MRKGSLSLSINAIVVLILAITILGLGLGFITKQFSAAEGQFEVTNQQLESDIIRELESSGDIVSMQMKEFSIESGAPMQFYMGIRNTDATDNVYYLQFVCDQTLNKGTCEIQGARDPRIPTDLYDMQTNSMSWFQTFREIQVSSGRGKAILVKLQASGGTETYKGRVLVWKCMKQNPQDCAFNTFNQDLSAPNPGSGGTVAENPVVIRYTLKVI